MLRLVSNRSNALTLYSSSYEDFYPDVVARSAAEGVYSRVITPQAMARLTGLLANTKGKIVFGGEVDHEKKFIAPTVVKDVGPDDSLMSEYVFVHFEVSGC